MPLTTHAGHPPGTHITKRAKTLAKAKAHETLQRALHRLQPDRRPSTANGDTGLPLAAGKTQSITTLRPDNTPRTISTQDPGHWAQMTYEIFTLADNQQELRANPDFSTLQEG